VERGEKDARRGRDSAVQRELPDRDIMRQRLGICGSNGREQAESDGKIVMRAFLWKIGR